MDVRTIMKLRTIRQALVASGMVIAVGAPAAVLAATPASAATTATVTVVHGIPNTPVDVYVNGTVTLPDFQFKTVTAPLSLPAGTYQIAVRPAGAASTTAPILSAAPTLTAGENVTIVANLSAAGAPELTPFVNWTSATPKGQARLVVRHTAAAPAVDVLAGGKAIVSNLTNPNQAALLVPAGTVSASVAVHGTTTPVIGPVSLNLAAGTTTIVYAIGSASAGTLTAVTQTYTVGQAAAPSSTGTPVAVPAGNGGQAVGGGTPVALVWLLLVAGVGIDGASILRIARR
jgi:hypothetical protein